VTCRHSPPLEIAAAWPWRERKPSKSEVLSARTKMASTSRTALWTGTAGHLERLEQIFDNLGKTEGVCAFPKKLQISSPILLAPYGRRGAEGPLLRGDFRFGIGQMN